MEHKHKTFQRIIVSLERISLGIIAYLILTDIKGTDTSVMVNFPTFRMFWVSVALTIGSLIWALYERQEKKRVIQKLSDLAERNRKLEAKLDENVSSSNLTREGNTNPEDE